MCHRVSGPLAGACHRRNQPVGFNHTIGRIVSAVGEPISEPVDISTAGLEEPRIAANTTQGGFLVTWRNYVVQNIFAQLIGTRSCVADLDCDGLVDIGDFLLVLAQWGPCPPDCIGDVDGDNIVGINDLLAVLAAWGPCP